MLKWQKTRGFDTTQRTASFHEAWALDHGEKWVGPSVFRGKTKVDGANASIQWWPDQSIRVCSRRQTLTSAPKSGYGFGEWGHRNMGLWRQLDPSSEKVISLVGEWAGPGIPGRGAVRQLKERVFLIFAITIRDPTEVEGSSNRPKPGDQIIVDPKAIADYLPFDLPEEAHILPWSTEPIPIDWSSTQTFEDRCNQYVSQWEDLDPYLHAVFGTELGGEGLVFYPFWEDSVPLEEYRRVHDYLFKAKGERHRVRVQGKAVVRSQKVSPDVEAFVARYVTEARLLQARNESEDRSSFLQWIGRDIEEESLEEREESGLCWKAISKLISREAMRWYSATS